MPAIRSAVRRDLGEELESDRRAVVKPARPTPLGRDPLHITAVEVLLDGDSLLIFRRDNGDVLRYAVCLNVVNPTGSVSSPISCPPRPW